MAMEEKKKANKKEMSFLPRTYSYRTIINSTNSLLERVAMYEKRYRSIKNVIELNDGLSNPDCFTHIIKLYQVLGRVNALRAYLCTRDIYIRPLDLLDKSINETLGTWNSIHK